MKPKHFIVGLLLIFALFFLAACTAGTNPPKLDNLKDYSPTINPHLLKDRETESYAKFLSLLENNPQEVRDGDIIIVTINDWPITLSEMASLAILEELILERIPFFQDVYINLMEHTLTLAMAEEKNVLPTQEELTTFGAEQKQLILNGDDFAKVESTIAKTGLTFDDYWANIQPYYDYRTLTGEKLWPLLQEEIVYTDEYKSDEDYWYEFMDNFMEKAEIKYITKIPELQFSF